MNHDKPIGPRVARSSAALASLCALMAVTMAGCNIFGPVFLLAHGPPKIYREHTLDKEKKVAILIDDPGARIPRTQLRIIMGEEAEQILLKKNLVGDAISARSTIAVAAQARGGEPPSITAIGRTVGADHVIWVGIESFSLTSDGQTYEPTVTATVKVIDVASDSRIWPATGPGYPLVIKRSMRTRDPPKTRSEAEQVHIELSKFFGRGIAELFYDEERIRSARGGG